MHAMRPRSWAPAVLVLSLVLSAGGAEALTAGTGTATVTVNLLTSRLAISVVFDAGTHDLGVDLGPLGTLSASNVALSNVNTATGASFAIPFANADNAFRALGDVACPARGCLAPASGPYGFVGFLHDIDASLPPDLLYTFDGSATCAGTTTLTCSGPFVLNAFPFDELVGGTQTIERMVSFRDSTTGATRTFAARVVLRDVVIGGRLDIAGLSRYRGAIPAGYALAGDGFAALFFDVATDAEFATARVCVEVDANRDGLVDGTALAATRLAILHAAMPGEPFAAVTLDFPPGFVCADALATLSPFVLLLDAGSSPGTTTTSLPGATTTTSTVAGTTSTSTTLPPACATARECLARATAGPLCEEALNPKLQKFLAKKAAAAAKMLGKSADAKTPAKAARLQRRARAAVNAILVRAEKFVGKKKGPISAACRDAIQAAFAPVLGAIEASRP